MAERIPSEMKGKPGYEGYLNDRVVSFQEVMHDGGKLMSLPQRVSFRS
jgi:arylsulfatase